MKHLHTFESFNYYHHQDEITDEGLKHLQNVKNISLDSCGNITDDGLEYLKNVEKLSLSCNSNITIVTLYFPIKFFAEFSIIKDPL